MDPTHRDDRNAEESSGHPDGVPAARLGDLLEVLERSRAAGLLGPGPVSDHVRLTQPFLDLLPHSGRVLDLGSGGGVPGLVVALARPGLVVVLLDAAHRRCRVLRSAVADLELGDRVEVVEARAELAAREPSLRHQVDAVTSRSFGPPAATAECAVGFLRGRGSTLLVSEPPSERGIDSAQHERWPVEGLAVLGLRLGRRARAGGATVQELVVEEPCDDRFPRRDGVPARRPLF